MAEVILIGGIAIALTFLIFIIKYKLKRYEDLTLDFGVSTLMLWLMAGTLTGVGIALAGSLIFSFLLLLIPGIGKKLLRK